MDLKILEAIIDLQNIEDSVPHTTELENQNQYLRKKFDFSENQLMRAKEMIEKQKSLISLFVQREDFGMKLRLACKEGNTKLIEVLLRSGTNANATRGPHGSTALHSAANDGHFEASKLLIKYGAEVDARNEFGWSPLHYAVRRGDCSVVKLLLQHGASPNALDEKNQTPLHVVAQEDHTDVLEILIQNGSDVNAKTVDDVLPIHITTWRGRHAESKILLEHGASLNAKSKKGWTPIGMAAINAHFQVVSLLLDYNADKQLQCYEKTPLQWAKLILKTDDYLKIKSLLAA